VVKSTGTDGQSAQNTQVILLNLLEKSLQMR
jgi:hypothetical protein